MMIAFAPLASYITLMRFFMFLFVLLASLYGMARAADATAESAVMRQATEAPKTKEKQPVTLPGTTGAAPARKGVPRWIDTDPEQRRTIVKAWYQLDDMTRPPFPAFREQWQKNQ